MFQDHILPSDEAVQVFRHQFAPVSEDNIHFSSEPRTSLAPPTMLAISTKFPGFAGFLLEKKIFAKLTIQMTVLHPVLMDIVKWFGTPSLESRLKATWSCAENSRFTTLTIEAYAYEGSDFDDEEVAVLKQSSGREVKLGLGDVAVEVAFTESHKKDSHPIQTISWIFGGFSTSTYSSVNQNNSVFYLGRIVSGPADFSFLRHYSKLGKVLPVEVGLWFTTKYSEEDD